MAVSLAGMGLFGGAGECAAQGVESLGVRALGMGGAFVAVADDATATYWNPAGLATGVIVSAVAERTQTTGGQPDGSGTFVGLALPPLGVSYYRIRSPRVLPSGAAASLVTQQVGATLVQSIGEVLDVAGTIKYVHGSAGAGTGNDTVDADLGALAHVGQFRAGLVIRNLREPSFDAPAQPDALTLDRQVRAGVAWQFAQAPTTLSCDVDLTRTNTGLEVRRHLAVGAEHLLTPRLAVRGGFRLNTVDDARPAGSAGVSVAVRSIWVDAQVTRGGQLADRTWGISARMGF